MDLPNAAVLSVFYAGAHDIALDIDHSSGDL